LHLKWKTAVSHGFLTYNAELGSLKPLPPQWLYESLDYILHMLPTNISTSDNGG
jgi:hypothetical protein